MMIHPTAEVSPSAIIGEGTRIWHQAQVREGARIGKNCNLGKAVYVDRNVQIGDNVKLQNYVLVCHGVTLEDGVFVGPYVGFTNDNAPRAITPDGKPKGDADWEVGPILVKYGASIGGSCAILPGVTIGRFALVGAGSVVTKDVPDHGVVFGNPARLMGYVCKSAHRMKQIEPGRWRCDRCNEEYVFPEVSRDSHLQAVAG
jgi:UDP-2-acetamido-3-amino-2,3-dideoxy-glucuronate N-acetyltransferase